MTTYVMRQGVIVEKGGPLDIEVYEHNAAPYVISDCMAGLKHHGTGKFTDSKSEFRKMTKASGCIEIGNEKQERKHEQLSRQDRAKDIKNTIEQLKSR